MAFLGYQFSFNGISSFEHGLMLYDINGNSQEDGSIASPLSIIEDKIPSTYKSLYYGASQNSNLEFTLVFGADECSIDKNTSLDRYDIKNISDWLTNVEGYKWLEIEQPDMENKRFRCIIQDLKMITLGWTPWAFSCVVHCDSPFAYTFPKTFKYQSRGDKKSNYSLYSESSFKGFYYPDIRIAMTGTSGRTVSLTNDKYPKLGMKFYDVPQAISQIYINGRTGEIKTDKAENDLDIYNRFNFNYFGLHGGNTPISVQGNCDIYITCEFPVNMGG